MALESAAPMGRNDTTVAYIMVGPQTTRGTAAWAVVWEEGGRRLISLMQVFHEYFIRIRQQYDRSYGCSPIAPFAQCSMLNLSRWQT